jgi:hypothetical protein
MSDKENRAVNRRASQEHRRIKDEGLSIGLRLERLLRLNIMFHHKKTPRLYWNLETSENVQMRKTELLTKWPFFLRRWRKKDERLPVDKRLKIVAPKNAVTRQNVTKILLEFRNWSKCRDEVEESC